MVFLYRGFDGSQTFKWCRGYQNRVTVLFPAEPFFDRCIERVLREYREGKEVLAWGNREGLDLLRATLKERNIPTVAFSEQQPSPPHTPVEPAPTLF